MEYGIELSQTSRATCKSCSEKIMKGEVALHVSWFGKLFFFPDFTSFHKKIDKLIHISMKTPYTNNSDISWYLVQQGMIGMNGCLFYELQFWGAADYYNGCVGIWFRMVSGLSLTFYFAIPASVLVLFWLADLNAFASFSS